ncbi:MAG: DUF3445 domain-containing protein [Candidatus Latescibacteria bacterium]|nr:DUF3445 domain-containing protein [Candidatus Latescibacterota bacterium]
MLAAIDFPLQKAEFSYDFGVRALPTGECPFRQTEDFAAEVELRRQVYRTHREETFAFLPDSGPLCVEVCDWIERTVPWVTADKGAGSSHPLERVGLQVQEDIAVMRDDAAGGFPIVAGLVCLPSGWSIRDKLGRSMGHTHEEVPGFAQHMRQKTEKLFAAMPPLRPVARRNWSINPAATLPRLPSQEAVAARDRRLVTPANAGQRCHLRVEYQTLTRMPATGAIVFTILTLQSRLEQLDRDQAKILAGVLRTCPDAVIDYKNLADIRPQMLAYFDRRLSL